MCRICVDGNHLITEHITRARGKRLIEYVQIVGESLAVIEVINSHTRPIDETRRSELICLSAIVCVVSQHDNWIPKTYSFIFM